MNEKIKKFLDIYFDDLPYSSEIIEVRKKIEKSLNLEYEKKLEESDKNAALEALFGEYNKLSDLAGIAGYSDEDVKRWRSNGEAKGLNILKKELKRQRRRIYGIAILMAGVCAQLFWSAYFLFVKPLNMIFNLLYAVILFAGALIIYRNLKKSEQQYKLEKYDNEAFIWLAEMSDKYAKRKLNGIAISSAIFSFILILTFNFSFAGNSKFAEIVENTLSDIIVLEVPLYLCIKNTLCQGMFQKRICFPNKEKYRRYTIVLTVFSAIYWAVINIILLLLRDKFRYIGNMYLMSVILFFAFVLIFNLTARKKLTYKNIVVNKFRVSVWTALIICVSGLFILQRDTWYTQSYINTIPVVEHNENKIDYNDETGVYTITSSSDDFKILHLTDIHIGGSLYSYHKDMKALKACYTEIEYTKPDLVVVTGDLCFPMGIMSMSLNNTAPVNQFAAFMRNLDIPWCFTYGNHDTESIASADKSELDEVYKSLSYKTSGNLLYPYIQPEVMGRNNQLIEIRNADGKLNTALFLIDSNAYTGEGVNVYDYIHDDQVEWYANEVQRLNSEEGHIVNSFAFFHIPLQQYRTAYKLYEKGSDEVKYYFGANREKTIDKVCCSDFPSSLFDRMVELKSTTGVFCGHDHYNNMSLEYMGIRLTYGMSIDYLAMPGIEKDTSQRGAELITLHPDSSWDLVQIPLELIAEKNQNQ